MWARRRKERRRSSPLRAPKGSTLGVFSDAAPPRLLLRKPVLSSMRHCVPESSRTCRWHSVYTSTFRPLSCIRGIQNPIRNLRLFLLFCKPPSVGVGGWAIWKAFSKLDIKGHLALSSLAFYFSKLDIKGYRALSKCPFKYFDNFSSISAHYRRINLIYSLASRHFHRPSQIRPKIIHMNRNTQNTPTNCRAHNIASDKYGLCA